MSAWEQSRGGCDNWQTPRYIFDALGARFDLDVAAPITGPLHVPADHWFHEGALEREWHGFVWMNPPFGGRNNKSRWLNRFFDHGNGIAFTPDRTSAPWFREAWVRATLVLFIPKVQCVLPGGTIGKSPSNGTALWAAGDRAAVTLCNAAHALNGIIARPLIA